MDRSRSSFTVLFQDPFWVGVAERWDGAGYRAAKVTFGAQPTDAEILQWVEKERSNPKRARREAARAVERRGLGTKAQQALSAQREQEGAARRARSREDRRAEAERKFLLRQEKKREKRRGR